MPCRRQREGVHLDPAASWMLNDAGAPCKGLQEAGAKGWLCWGQAQQRARQVMQAAPDHTGVAGCTLGRKAGHPQSVLAPAGDTTSRAGEQCRCQQGSACPARRVCAQRGRQQCWAGCPPERHERTHSWRVPPWEGPCCHGGSPAQPPCSPAPPACSDNVGQQSVAACIIKLPHRCNVTTLLRKTAPAGMQPGTCTVQPGHHAARNLPQQIQKAAKMAHRDTCVRQ